MPDCVCNIPNGGWCERHQVRKTAHWVQLCQTNAQYRQAWDSGRGPGQLQGRLVLPRIATPVPSWGPGTELKKLLEKFWIVDTGGCQCKNRARIMDIRGCDWCRDNSETVVGWLRAEARKRHLPFIGKAAQLLLRRAIRNAERLAAAAQEVEHSVAD